jgi:hypothetical protein
MAFDLKKYLAMVANTSDPMEVARHIIQETGDANGITPYLQETYSLGTDIVKNHMTPEEFMAFVSSVQGQAMTLVNNHRMKDTTDEERAMALIEILHFMLDNKEFLREFTAALIGELVGITVTEGWSVSDATDGLDVQLPPL